MATICYTSADLLAVRSSLLDVGGDPLCGETDGTAYDMKPVSLQITPTVDAGQTVTNRAGDGSICYTRTTPDVPTGADLVLTICVFDVELIGLMGGYEVYTENGAPAMAVGTQVGDPVETHFWTNALDGSSPVAAPNTYWHHVYPNVTWTVGNHSFVQDALQMVLNGKAQVSSSIGAGGFSDIPTTPTDPYWWNVWTSDDLPDPDASPYNQDGATCGFIDTPACSPSSP
jgi:hypothetical protein